MDEFNQGGVDPDTKKYFKKILDSFSVGLAWMLFMAMAGLYYKLAIIDDQVNWYNIVFYIVFFISLLFLLRYYFKLWKDKEKAPD